MTISPSVSQPDAITNTVDCLNSTNTETADIYADLVGQDDEVNGLHTTDLIQFQGTHSRDTDYWEWDFVAVEWRKASE